MPRERRSTPIDEANRLAVLAQYRLVDTPPEVEFDHVVQLAADLFKVPTALISLVGDAAELARLGHPIRMGVNLFAAQLRDVAFRESTFAALEASGLPADLLELEITETTVLGLDKGLVGALQQLRDRGIGIAFDDYGTGYASLSLLKLYPLTRLKIDRAFVMNLETDRGDAAIVRAVLALGGSLGLEIIAEGIETDEQASILKALGCVEAQGYLFGKPQSADEFRELMDRPPLRLAS